MSRQYTVRGRTFSYTDKTDRQARNESATALDFVSLLLSRYPSSSGKSSMSPFLQQNVPLGSLGVEPVQRPAIGEAEKRNNEMVAMGWRVRSLNSAADSLLASATRLGAEVRKETNYWDKLLTVKDEGWSVSRLPRDKHTLGVRFGFTEGTVTPPALQRFHCLRGNQPTQTFEREVWPPYVRIQMARCTSIAEPKQQCIGS